MSDQADFYSVSPSGKIPLHGSSQDEDWLQSLEVRRPHSGISSSSSVSDVFENANLNQSSSGILGTLSNGINKIFTRKNAIIAAKVLVVVLLVAGLIAASVFTFGAVGAIAGVGIGVFVAKGAVIGTGVGLALSAPATAAIATQMKMFEATEKNIEDTLKFVGVSLVVSTFITAYCASSGANEGLRWGLIATIICGGGAAIGKK